MHPRFKTLVFTGGLLASSLPVTAAPKSDVDAVLKQWLGNQPGGVAAAYIDADGVTFFNAGKFSPGDERPITPDTLFEIGSVTKVFTSILLAQAVTEKVVKLEDRVGSPLAESNVTYLQLATHTSGLPRLPEDFFENDPLDPYADKDLAGLVKSFAASAPKATPRETSDYSNFGFAVLGQALVGAWKHPYGELMNERVLQRLGMRDTHLSWKNVDQKRLAPPHNEQGVAKNWSFSAYAPAGSLVSSTRDLAIFVQDCLGFRETSLAAVLAETMKPQLVGAAAGQQHGLGWIVSKRGESVIVGHSGATGGYQSTVVFDTTSRTGVVALTNRNVSVDALAGAILAGRGLPVARTAPEASAKAKEYLGNYPLAPSFVAAITAEGDALFLQATGQPRVKLRALAADRYAVLGVDAEVSFERDGAGKVAALVLHQSGMDQRAPRLEVGAAPTAPKETTLTEAELDDYVGRYRLAPVEFTVTREGGRLMVQITGQPAARVFASAKDEFFYKSVNAQLSFVREGGKIVALVLHQAGQNPRAEKVP